MTAKGNSCFWLDILREFKGSLKNLFFGYIIQMVVYDIEFIQIIQHSSLKTKMVCIYTQGIFSFSAYLLQNVLRMQLK